MENITNYLILGVSFLVAALLLMRNRVTELSKRLVVNDRNGLPSMISLFIRLLIGKKTPPSLVKEDTSSKKEKELLSVYVKELTFLPLELKEFIKLCGFSESSLFHVLPHVLGQRLLLALITNSHFPFSLMGALHLKSFFEVYEARLLEDFIRTISASPTHGTFSMEAKYWGMLPNVKHGTDIVVTLELFHNESKKPVWKEILILFSKKKTTSTHPKAKEIYDHYHELYNFTNLHEEGQEIHTHGDIQSKGKETWVYGLLSGDVNPIHMSSWLAKLFGQKGRIAHGMMILGKALTQLESRDSFVPLRLAVSFKGPVPCDSTVEIKKKGKPVAPKPEQQQQSSDNEKDNDQDNEEDKKKSNGGKNHKKTKEPTKGEEKKEKIGKDTPPLYRNFDLYVTGSTRPNICVRAIK
jgi:acyl dehydratase